MSRAKILVTGAAGFLGAWVTRGLLERGVDFALFDRDPSPRRLEALLPEPPASYGASLEIHSGDIADPDAVRRAVETSGATAVIHLAALQMPACQADPILGASVNVIGTLAVFEAAKRVDRLERVVYASSAAVIGPEEVYDGRAVTEADPLRPATHYGVFKQANEGAAAVYFERDGIPSVGLRPWTIYGLGRDQGLTSDVTRAIKAAFLGREYKIRYTGRNALDYAGDVAAAFVAAALDERPVCKAFNMRGQVVAIDEFLAELARRAPASRGKIRAEGPPIPVACDLDDSALRAFLPELPRTSIAEGVDRTWADFERLAADGRLDASDLEG